MNQKFLMLVSDLQGDEISCSEVVKELQEILNFMNECNKVKYASYRASLKLRIIQKKFFMDNISLKIIHSVFEKHQLLKTDNLRSFDPAELEPVLSDMYFIALKEMSHSIRDFLCQLMIYLLLNIYDKEKKGKILVLSSKIFLALICQDNPREKYHYMFYQLMDLNNCLSKKKLTILLKNLIQAIEFIGEEKAFGMCLIPGTIESCFKNDSHNVTISEENFMLWLMENPQLLVWFSLFYRLQISEKVSHKVKCNICKIYPIVGLRYKCLRCFSCNLCQICFFAGKSKKKHKLNHPIREYCHVVSAKNSCKAFLLTLQNMMCKKQSKLQYLPAQKTHLEESGNLNKAVALDNIHSFTDTFPLSELQSIILNLEAENKKLISQFEVLSRRLESSKFDENHTELLNYLLKHKLQIDNLVRRLTFLQRFALPSIKPEYQNKDDAQIPIASTPVINLFVTENRRQKFNKGLENLSPIKLFDISQSNLNENENQEKRMMWQNYDFGSANGNSWEELKTNTSKLNATVPELQEKYSFIQCLSSKNKNELETQVKSLIMSKNDDSNFSQKELFSWLLKSDENLKYVSDCENSIIDGKLKEVQNDLKQTVDKLRDLSLNLILNDFENENGKIFAEIENVESLLTGLIEGVGKFVEVQERKL